jgi:hypothetical protein
MRGMKPIRHLSDSVAFARNKLVYVARAYYVSEGRYEPQWECVTCAKQFDIDGASMSGELAIARCKDAAEDHHEKHHK